MPTSSSNAGKSTPAKKPVKRKERKDAIKPVACAGCGKVFKGRERNQKFCTHQCATQFSDSGRPVFAGKDVQTVLAKCAEVWRIGSTDAEAAFYADVSTSALSRYITSHPEVGEYRDKLREFPKLKARQAVVNNLTTYDTGMDYLERKGGEEFLKRPAVAPPIEQHFHFDREDHANNPMGKNTETGGSVEVFNGSDNH